MFLNIRAIPFSNYFTYFITLLNSSRGLNKVTELASQLISTPSLLTQPMKGCITPPGRTSPTLYKQQFGFFYVPQDAMILNACHTGYVSAVEVNLFLFEILYTPAKLQEIPHTF